MSRSTRRAHRAGDDSRFESRIVLEGITKVYHPSPPWMRMLVRTNIREDVVALDGVGFSVSEGEICAIVGPNGAGKTTIFRIAVGLAERWTSTCHGVRRNQGIRCSAPPRWMDAR